MRAVLFVNPRSRRGRQLGAAVRLELARNGIESVEARAAGGRIDAIVVAGGDGTFARHISRAIELDVPVGIVPLGTFNDLARTLAIPLDLGAACALIASGETRRIDVARVNGVYYATEASVGISSRVAKLQKSADKQRFGFAAIAVSVLRAVRFSRPFRAEIAYDGECATVETVQLTVANSQRFGGFITVNDAAIDDGWLDLYAVEGAGLGPAIRILAAIVAHRGRSAQGVRTFRSTAFSVSTRRPHRITADGEPAGTTPARFEILPGAVRVFAPVTERSRSELPGERI
ncbi:MAG TPA: YegS/Rv2252/BmrU family lipid kinase [Candidatus Cybelea sp.]|nr:YegS/Rv2252/BmrU family lipid kinase [Candidatus Cybelea sp.]